MLSRVKPENVFFKYCISYDTIIIDTIRNSKDIDKGEAEAYAQFKKVNAHILVTDDNRFIKSIKKIDLKINIYTSLHIISWLDLADLIPNWVTLVKHLHSIRPFDSKDLRESYIKVAKDLGLSIPKKRINDKCSLKKII
jgi:predicted nucleic acid-binding protein